MKLEMLEN